MNSFEHWSNVAHGAGHRSLRAWAISAGYSPQTVYSAIRVWGHRHDAQPLGGINRQIMASLRALESKQGNAA